MWVLLGVFIFIWASFSPYFSDNLISRMSDLNGNLTQTRYVIENIHVGIPMSNSLPLSDNILLGNSFPQWNFFINQGIPTIADPLLDIFYPPVFIAHSIFNPLIATYALIIFSLLFGGVSMYMILQKNKGVPLISFLSAVIYCTNSYVAARITAGHIEKILSYGLYPLTVYFIVSLYTSCTRKKQLLYALLLSFLLYTGDLYALMYILCISVFMEIVSIVRKRTLSYTPAILMFFALSAFRILPIIELQPYIAKVAEPFHGSQNIISMLYYLFIPVRSIFETLHIDSFIVNEFAWWEKISYIGFSSIIGFGLSIYAFFRFKQRHILVYLLLLLPIYMLATPAALIHPFHYLILLFPSLQLFHVPSRIFAPLSVVIIIMASYGFSYVSQKNTRLYAFSGIILIVSILSIGLLNHHIFSFRQRPHMPHDISTHAILQAHSADPSEFGYIAQRVSIEPLDQLAMQKAHIKILNSNYGLQLKNSLSARFTPYDFENKDIGTYLENGGIIPQLVYTSSARPIVRYSNNDRYISLIDYQGNQNGYIEKYSFGVNTLTIEATVTGNSEPATATAPETTLQILESWYPGWSVYIDGVEETLLQNTFLTVRALPGKHTYIFRVSSQTFRIGVYISAIAWGFVLVLGIRGLKRNIFKNI